MSGWRRLLWVALVTVGLAGCAGTDTSNRASTTPLATATPLPRSLKGYELYSWQADGQWHFALITGTNRSKTTEEITTGEDSAEPDGIVRVRSVGVEGITKTLTRLPAGEEIVWGGGPSDATAKFTLPPETIVQAVQEQCRKVGLSIAVST